MIVSAGVGTIDSRSGIENMVAMDPKATKEDICLWIDGVGGYAMCSADRFRFGSASGRDLDAAIFADIPGNVFTIAAVQESAVLNPEIAGITINGRPVERPCILKDQDRIEILGRVGLLHRRPYSYSRTSVLTLTTRHRWNHHVDGVILMSQFCSIGNTTKSHIFNPHTDVEWLLMRDDEQWNISCRRPESLSERASGDCKQAITPMRRFKGEGIH